jgi:lipopolysaccharide/colanic/teichoic acid biosynthesis glycosyltransferase
MTRNRIEIPISKRALDLAVSVTALLLLAPVMLLVAALIKLCSPGPVFYIGRRAGYKGRPYGQIKFRTMHVGADRDGSFTRRNDARVFPLGRVLRLLRLDELPQFFNVLKGEMSVVGPRPEDYQIVQECYTPEWRRTLEVPPGLTGLRQVRLFPDCSSLDKPGVPPMEYYRSEVLPKLLAIDLEYVRRRTFWLDVYLIAATFYLIACKSWFILLAHRRGRTLVEPRAA